MANQKFKISYKKIQNGLSENSKRQNKELKMAELKIQNGETKNSGRRN